jgi:hypothetical protein
MKHLAILVVMILGFSGGALAKGKAKLKAADLKGKPKISISVACHVQTSGDSTDKSDLSVTVDLENPSIEFLSIEIYEDFKTQVAASSVTKVSKTQSVAKFESKYCAENEIRVQIIYRRSGSEEKMSEIQSIQMGQTH